MTPVTGSGSCDRVIQVSRTPCVGVQKTRSQFTTNSRANFITGPHIMDVSEITFSTCVHRFRDVVIPAYVYIKFSIVKK